MTAATFSAAEVATSEGSEPQPDLRTRVLAWRWARTLEPATLKAQAIGVVLIQAGLLLALADGSSGPGLLLALADGSSGPGILLALLWAGGALWIDRVTGLALAGLYAALVAGTRTAAPILGGLADDVTWALLGAGLFVAGFARTVYQEQTRRLAPEVQRPLPDLLADGWTSGAQQLFILRLRGGTDPAFARRLHDLRSYRFPSGRTRPWENWAITQKWLPAEVHYPADADELSDVVRRAHRTGRRVRVVGTAYSWSRLTATDDVLICLCLMRDVEVDTSDPDRPLAHVQAGATGRELTRALNAAGLAMPTNVVMETVSWGGMVGVGAHGSGRDEGTLSDRVVAIELIDASGRHRRFERGVDPDPVLDALGVALGTCGIIHRITLRVERHFDVLLEEEMVPPDEVFTDLAERIEKHEYFDIYWMAFAKTVWVRWWNRTDRPRTRHLPQPLWDHHSDRNHWGLWISSVQALIFHVLLVRSQDFVPRLAPVLGRLFSSLFRVRTRVTTIEEATHFRSAIELDRVGCAEVAFAVDEHAESARRAWDIVQETRKQWADLGRHPLNMTLNLRFIGRSRCLLSSAYGNERTCYIEILGSHLNPDWQPFMDTIASRWLNELPNARPHWGKQLEQISALPESLHRNMGKELRRFLKIRHAYALDREDMFVNPTMRQIFLEAED